MARGLAMGEGTAVGDKWMLGVLLGLMLMFLGGCAARQTVILIAEPDGQVGKVEVATVAGRQLLAKPGDMSQVSGPTASPSPVTTADPAYIANTFGAVLAAEPARPERFTLYFESGTTSLNQESQAAIPAILAAAKQRAAISIAISGHADATGSDQVNDRLAPARAARVKEILVQQGLAPGLLSVSSHGKGNPAVTTAEGVAEPRNRRVEVIVQ
jgi:outer membrane protein OmpA-like peptidoglycan-associated protein